MSDAWLCENTECTEYGVPKDAGGITPDVLAAEAEAGTGEAFVRCGVCGSECTYEDDVEGAGSP